jgi:hypothetical protein
MEDRPDPFIVQLRDVDVSDREDNRTVVMKKAQTVFGERPAYGPVALS